MGRKRNPIQDSGPVGQFAQKLRTRMDQVPGRTFRKMGATANYSHSALADAASGKKFPTWEATQAFLKGCEATESEIETWKHEWAQTQATLGTGLQRIDQPGVVVTTNPSTGQATRVERLRPVTPHIADPEEWHPRPDRVQTFDDLLYELTRLKIAAGNPALRTLARMTDWRCSTTLLSDVFSGKRPPTFYVLNVVCLALLRDAAATAALDGPKKKPWMKFQSWADAWRRAEFNRERPDLNRPRRYGNIFLVTDATEETPTAGIIAEMGTDVAAALLASLPPKVASNIIVDLPTKKAQEILTAIEVLHRSDHKQAEIGTAAGT
ncbi:magnesium and cobalt transport protein CorA [Nocardia tengchongensis]|uniref:hypothetical protein n=1 Tax=Nocardia tengchongensis TaxID=2055889 RepID=UPI0036AC826D